MSRKFDAIIVGAGQAGPSLAGRLTAAGMSVAMIERKLFGGTCVNTGCIPTKTLVASAHAAHMARRGGDFGVLVGGPVAVDMKKVKARKDEVSGDSRRGVETWLDGMERCTVFRGHARFESPRTISVNGELLEASRIFLNLGGRASVPDMPGLDQVSYLTNTTILELDTLPRHLVIVGGSYIGLEFAQMYRRFGAEVTVIERGARLIQHEDEDVSAAVKGILENEGITVHLDAECIGFARRGDDIAVVDQSRAARRRSARTCCWRSGGGRTPTTSASTKPAWRPTSAATSPSTTSCRPMFPASGRSATATARAPSRTPPTTISRSLRPTCSTTIRAASATASRPMRSISIRRSGVPG